MKVYTVPQPERQSVAIYVIMREEDDGTKHCLFMDRQSARKIQRVPMGGELPYYMILPDEIAEPLADALRPPFEPDATERHLDDAVEVRDRLLGLVERLTGGAR